MINEKKFSCPTCGTAVAFSYAITIADGKRYVCKRCGTHLIPATNNVIYYRLTAITLTLLFALTYSYAVFGLMGYPRVFVSQLVMLLAAAAFYLLATYLLVVRVVRMKAVER